jgi:hypothetical protein
VGGATALGGSLALLRNPLRSARYFLVSRVTDSAELIVRLRLIRDGGGGGLAAESFFFLSEKEFEVSEDVTHLGSSDARAVLRADESSLNRGCTVSS